MTERAPGVWRLQTTSDLTLSRTIRGTKRDAAAELQCFVSDTGAGLQDGSTVTVAVLLQASASNCTVSDTSSPPNYSPTASTYGPCRTGSDTPARQPRSTSTGPGSPRKTKPRPQHLDAVLQS
jgi:hypothetical protein